MCTARKPGFCLVTLMLLTYLEGCQRGQAPLTLVSGKVAYKGLALQRGMIVFTPDNSRGGTGPIAFGKISQDGPSHLYKGDNRGARAGWYRGTVMSLAPTGVAVAGQSFNPPYSLLPEKY